MCTLALYFHALEGYPLIVAANRDEFFDRPSAPPQVLQRRPLIFGGKDLRSGGTWLGVNEHGLLAGILNRRSNTGAKGTAARSRGLLCLDILTARDPLAARALVGKQRGSDYQPFNLLFAGKERAFVAANLGEEISCVEVEKGLHVLGNTAVYDARSEKMQHAYRLFSTAKDRWERSPNGPPSLAPLKAALRDHSLADDSNEPKGAICVHTESYGTVSSSIIIYAEAERRFASYHASGPPCRQDFKGPVAVEVR
jgi:uncharacterized protein with NRDE domain